MWLWLIGAWVGLNVLVGIAFVLAGERRASGRPLPSRREVLTATSLLTLCAAAALTAVDSWDAAHWRPAALVGVLASLALASDVLPVRSDMFRISGSFMAIVLAAALLGPAPAVAIGLAGTVVDAVRRRPAPFNLLANLTAYAVFPLLLGLLLAAARSDLAPQGYALAVVAAALGANLLNFAMVAWPVCHVARRPFEPLLRTAWLPLLPWQLVTGVVLGLTVLGAEEFGFEVVGIVAVALIVLQLLLKAVIERQERGAELDMRLEQLSARHEGMLGLVLHAQGLRDPTAVRHAAAVAHHARALAVAAGLSEHDQAIVHTAGLLHDLGKAALPDAVLHAERELEPHERAIVERHPVESARLVRKVPGLGPVAAVIEAHHERPDGAGYPYGLEGDDIPLLGRVLAVAEVWDALTAPDSYRGRLDNRAAAAELRRVAGRQLDENLVGVFLREVVSTRRFVRDTVDVEHELRFERDAQPLLDTPAQA